jgi:hypothetical protein
VVRGGTSGCCDGAQGRLRKAVLNLARLQTDAVTLHDTIARVEAKLRDCVPR